MRGLILHRTGSNACPFPEWPCSWSRNRCERWNLFQLQINTLLDPPTTFSSPKWSHEWPAMTFIRPHRSHEWTAESFHGPYRSREWTTESFVGPFRSREWTVERFVGSHRSREWTVEGFDGSYRSDESKSGSQIAPDSRQLFSTLFVFSIFIVAIVCFSLYY